MADCVVVGAGGHAAVVIEALRAEGRHRPLALLDADPARIGSKVVGVEVVGSDGEAQRVLPASVRGFVIGVGRMRDPAARAALFRRYCELGYTPLTVIHPAAVVSASAVLGAGTVAFAGALVNARAVVGDDVVLNTGSIVEHDCRIGSHSFLAPRACLAGAVELGSAVFVGMGAVIIEGLRVGSGAVIGAGSTVLRDVAAGERAVGLVR